MNLQAAFLWQDILRSGFSAPMKRCSQAMEVVKGRKLPFLQHVASDRLLFASLGGCLTVHLSHEMK